MMSSTIRSTRCFEEGAHLPAIGDDAGAQAVLLQVVADQFADLAVVVNDQDVIDVFHRVRSCLGCAVYRARSALPAVVCIAVYLARLQIQAQALRCLGGHKRDTWQREMALDRGATPPHPRSRTRRDAMTVKTFTSAALFAILGLGAITAQASSTSMNDSSVMQYRYGTIWTSRKSCR
jgi:hypothetical protein